MKIILTLTGVLLSSTIAFAAAGEFRTWTRSDSKTVSATLIGFDGTNVALKLANGQSYSLPLAQLSATDQTFVKALPVKLAPRKSPESVEVSSSSIEVKLASEASGDRKYVYRSEGFEYTSQGKLLPSLMKEVARTFEATKKLVGALPWGVVCKPPEGLALYQAALFETRDDYFRAGGPTNSGGVYMTGEKIFKIPFESLGIKPLAKSFTKDENYNSDTLVHEITHQMMHDYLPYLPKWAIEGSAEYTEMLPYKAGKFGVARHKEGLKDYLEVWRSRGRTPKLPNVAELFRLKRMEWDMQSQAQTRQHELYQQSALMVYFFNHLDGDGTGANWSAFMDATLAESAKWKAYEQGFKAYRAAMDEFFKLPGVKKLDGGRFTFPSTLTAPQPPAAPDGKPYDDETPMKHLSVLLAGRTEEQLQADIVARFAKAGIKLSL